MEEEGQNITSNNQHFEHSSNGKCQNLHKGGRFISFRMPNPIMVVRNRLRRTGQNIGKPTRLPRPEKGFLPMSELDEKHDVKIVQYYNKEHMELFVGRKLTDDEWEKIKNAEHFWSAIADEISESITKRDIEDILKEE